MTPANSTPTPSAIQLCRGVCVTGGLSMRSHIAMKPIASAPRSVDSVSTSAPLFSTILANTSATENDTAAVRPGARSGRRLDAKGEFGVFTEISELALDGAVEDGIAGADAGRRVQRQLRPGRFQIFGRAD